LLPVVADLLGFFGCEAFLEVAAAVRLPPIAAFLGVEEALDD